MQIPTGQPGAGQAEGAARARRGVGRLLAGMRIRKKLVFLHTCFSLVLAGVLAVAMGPAIREVVRQAEQHEATVLLDLVLAERARAREGGGGAAAMEEAMRVARARAGPGVVIRSGPAEALGLGAGEAASIRGQTYGGVVRQRDGTPMAVVFDNGGSGAGGAGATGGGEFVSVSVAVAGARAAVVKLYVIAVLALLAVYFLVALALELFVLPQHVYAPIATLLRADEALREGRREEEVVPAAAMPADELGEIMRSRNESVLALRRHEADLAAALARLEEANNDLRKKNHLLEMARRNLADADRLASLGMMSAGIAHELNTPLAVLKGMVERLAASRAAGDGVAGPSADEAALMLRVVGRLERLSEALLDFARVRPHRSVSVSLRPLVDEAWVLVRLDREAREVEFVNQVPDSVTAWCDPDRIMQVLVNLLRNAVDAVAGGEGGAGVGARRVEARGERLVRDEPGGSGTSAGPRPWASLRVLDSGPGISPDMLGRLFQPFVTTRLDARGTGLGLAVAEGIVREHGGVIVAGNRSDGVRGAAFEVLLPAADEAVGAPEAAGAPGARA